ncbi:MAG TPA: phospholipase D-like domain-containing protein [Polyangiaceae bacterium]|nr:phospholipase D-like domain-containing protein [Polyangiaceae bacterium]
MSHSGGFGLSKATDTDLEALLATLDRGELRPPFTETTLQARGLGHLVSMLEPYLGLDEAGLRGIADVVLAERRHRRAAKLTLVWSGDDPGVSHSRHTRVVLPELFARAREHVLVAGYSFDHGADLFPALHRVMADHGVTADFFVDVHQVIERLKPAARTAGLDWALLSMPLQAARDPLERGRATVTLFRKLMWPFGDPGPTVYFDPRTAEHASPVSLHAKCVVIDHECTLITSANFTERGQTRNLEAGVFIEDRAFAGSLERQWRNLVEAGVVVRS